MQDFDLSATKLAPLGDPVAGALSGEALDLLPVGIYVCDRFGHITTYNKRAAELWGREPAFGEDGEKYCGSLRLHTLGGAIIPHTEYPMAVALETGRSIRDETVLIERPDGTRVVALVNIEPIRDAEMCVIGAVNVFSDHGISQSMPISGSSGARESDAKHRLIFDNARVALWDEDFSGVMALLDEIRTMGVTDIKAHLDEHPELVDEAIRRVKVNDVNPFTLELYEARSKDEMLRSLADVFVPETTPIFVDELVTLWNGGRHFKSEARVRTITGKPLDIVFTMAFEGECCERTLVSILDISAQKAAERALIRQSQRLDALNGIAKAITSDHDLENIVQTVTDAATNLIGAKFGAFFYNVVGDEGDRFMLYTLSGAPREAFEKFGMPRKTAVFAPTFEGASIVRSDDIRKDPRYGNNPPHGGMPAGHLPVVSYLAVPVLDGSGEALGGLFFGHDKPAMFDEEAERIVSDIASHTAIALENANLLQAARREVEQRRRAEAAAHRLAAIVESSDDAILALTLDGVIVNWNEGAQVLFGYAPDEVLGCHMAMLIPADRQDEEEAILERIRRGEHVKHYETIRRRKDGSPLAISLTLSPLRNSEGTVIGASKIARDITEKRRAEDQQRLLLREMNHRVKNLFALSGSIVGLSARTAKTPKDLAGSVQERLSALARAHELTLKKVYGAPDVHTTSLHALIRTLTAPYENAGSGTRIAIAGPDLTIGASALTNLALLLHEFATNAAKYGALSVSGGRIDIACRDEGEVFVLDWTERGGPPVQATSEEGFGTLIGKVTVKGQLNGEIVKEWNPEGLRIRLSISRKRVSD